MKMTPELRLPAVLPGIYLIENIVGAPKDMLADRLGAFSTVTICRILDRRRD